MLRTMKYQNKFWAQIFCAICQAALPGPQTDQMLRSYYVDKTIISCKGFDMENGITDSNELHARNKKTRNNITFLQESITLFFPYTLHVMFRKQQKEPDNYHKFHRNYY